MRVIIIIMQFSKVMINIIIIINHHLAKLRLIVLPIVRNPRGNGLLVICMEGLRVASEIHVSVRTLKSSYM